ncbi:nuclear pore complex protein Nup153 isoform X2 [Spea bombifrons]|uniref:nuclear pore complex protein Nup153 isoform X2 n=1 Tax=Spea bombifrons TaxID=233779 RepID=UPI0023493492|nr:nuclear pore complex protein Nup153 isoform X2 [Spea bombifrons]
MAAAAGGDDGAGTGGKIRSRRYHVSAGKTPYSKNRQPGQQGIITRVTDTVKSIVPAWLQKYFNKDASDSGRLPVSNEFGTEHSENDVDHHVFVNDERPAPAEGNVTPEPVRLEEEPTTSRFSLNVHDGLTRPSLHRTNLNFDVLDSPALHCQPSTSSAFPIGSSGFSLVKEIKDSTSQHDDDNISTTSGFSSRASDKDLAVSKGVSAPPLWSPEADRSNSLVHNSSLSAKKPTFNLSAFGVLSPSLSNNSVLKSSRLGDSPFYHGKTVYGGAAARSARVRATPYEAPLRRQVKAKPSNAQSYGVISSAARRILQSLEKMSTPLADAKKIPTSPPPQNEREVPDFTEIPSKRKKVDASYPPVRQLVTPKPALVSANTSLYIKPSLTPSGLTSTCRKIQRDKHQDSKKNNVPDGCREPQPERFPYPKFSTPASNGLSSAGGKMMRERGSHYTAKPADEVPDVPDLPEVPLPLSTAALPSFNFPTMSGKTSPVTVPKTADNQAQNTFTFSTPILKSTESNAQIPGSSIGFTFSAPSVKVYSASNAVACETPKRTNPAKSPVHARMSGAKKKDDDEPEGFFKPAKTLKEGSVLDILKSPGFSSTTASSLSKSTSPLTKNAGNNVTFGDANKPFGLWGCNSCLLENNASDGKCVACSAGKEKSIEIPNTLPPTASTPPSASFQGFGELFKVPEGTWDCDTCLVQNKREATKCVACSTLKPCSEAKAPLIVSPKKTEISSAAVLQVGTMPSFQFDDKFKRPVGSWECAVCCVQNKAEDKKCVSCTTDKPGSSPVKTQTLAMASPLTGYGLLDQFKKPAGSWDCDVCLVQNKAENTKCVSCESAKPGSKQELKGASTNSTSTSATTVTFSFPKVTGDFKFGTASSSIKAPEKKDTGLSLGSTVASTNPVPTPAFKFGTDSLAPADTGNASKPLISGFAFGTASNVAVSPPATVESFLSTGMQSQPAMAKSTLTPSFGLMSSNEKKHETPAFSLGKIEQNKEPSPFVFGRKDEKTDSTTSGTTLIFGNKRDDEAPKPFVFGKPEQTNNSLAPSPFVFGESNPVEKATDPTPKPAFVFGSQVNLTTATTTGNIGKDASSSLQSGFTSVPQSSLSTISSNLFGSATLASTPASTSNLFGSATLASTPASTSNLFGSATLASTPASTSNLFGSATLASTPASTGNLFGSATLSSAPASTSSVFGSATLSSAPASTSSVFGSATLTSAPASTSSVFGSATLTSAPASTSSVFGSATLTSAPASTSNVFGSATLTSTPASTSNVFGSATLTSTPASTGNVFGSATLTSTPASTGNVFGSATPAGTQAVSSTMFGTASSVAPANSSALFGINVPSASSASFGGTNPSPFVFGSSQTPAAQAGLSIVNPVPAFGQNASAPPAFGSSAAAPLFPASSPSVPAFGSITSSVQPPMFGQQAAQPAFGSNAVPPAGTPFQFGANTNFNFTGGSSGSSSSTPGVFAFGANTAGAPAQSATPGFGFNQTPTFNMGSSGKSTIANRKIKTARRRK